MTGANAVVTICSSVLPVLVALGGAIRYLVRILASIERVAGVAADAARQIHTHIEHSDAQHAALFAKAHEHDTQLAVINTKLGGSPPS